MPLGDSRRSLIALVVLLVALLARAAAAASPVTIEDWTGYAPGTTGIPAGWSVYRGGATVRYPPAIALDDGRAALRLATERYSIRLGKRVEIDLARTPVLEWEWKALVLPAQGDLRTKFNDQAGRIMVVFGPFYRPTVIWYVWDTRAPVGTEETTRSYVDRSMIVVRSGADDVGRWKTETRDVGRDYGRVFGKAPTSAVRAIGVESHSEDADHRSEVLLGRILFRPA